VAIHHVALEREARGIAFCERETGGIAFYCAWPYASDTRHDR
jgi:hypothetical protein